MKLQLKLNMPDAEQEAVWLNDYIAEQEIDALETEVLETSPEKGTMDGGIFTGIIGLAITETVKGVVASVFDILFRHFDGKRAEFELTGECPENGKKFSLKFDNTTKAKRNEAIKEFDLLYEKICG